MNQRLLKRKFLFLFFFALFTMITACEKDTIERHENPEKQIEKVRLDEITEWYSKTGSQWSKKVNCFMIMHRKVLSTEDTIYVCH